MANQEHLDILKRGVEVWNEWREKHPGIQPDLSEANCIELDLHEGNLHGANLHEVNLHKAAFSYFDFSEADLYGADLSEGYFHNSDLPGANLGTADLSNADLGGADLRGANLHKAKLYGTYLFNADLREANLSEAELSKANLMGVYFNEADLRGANFSFADLRFAHLDGADLSSAVAGWTIFADLDLRTVNGLATITHRGPSTIGLDTILRSQGKLPEAFIHGAGLSDVSFTYLSLAQHSIDKYYTCFISYSSKDKVFVRRLYMDLQRNNVCCWFAPEGLKWGDKIRIGIDEAISLHDKVLLILSRHSVESGWVEHEVRTALARERKEKQVVLFPIRLDKAVLDSPLSWATEIRHERNIGDFTLWKKNHDEYQKAFTRLLRDLKAEA